jgi:hypothetical protein
VKIEGKSERYAESKRKQTQSKDEMRTPAEIRKEKKSFRY